jgi:acetolactate decarboxylase
MRHNKLEGKLPGLLLSLLIAVFLVIGVLGCSHSPENRDILFQASTMNALLEGNYDGDMTYKELKQHGDFGIGTFNALDGEMIALEGEFYQIKADGVAYPVSDSVESPFAAVTFFETDKSASLNQAMNYTQLEQYLDSLLPRKDIFYAIKIEGTFQYMEARSVPPQDKPYPPLAEAIKNQTIFKFQEVEGTMVGFWCPDYAAGINAAGYHFHFIDENREAGGHVLECQIENVEIEIDYTSELQMVLPGE